MDMNQILGMVGRMFPSANLNGAIQKAQQMMQGTPDTLEGVSAAARKFGIDGNSINSVFQKYGNTAQARMLCSMLGTTPEALKQDADRIVGGDGTNYAPKNQGTSTRFPRLK